MLFALILLVAVFATAAGTAYLYERIARNTPTNFAPYRTQTPYELAPEEPDEVSYPVEPVFDENQLKSLFLSEDEEEVQALIRSGQITKEQVPDVLDALGITNHELHFD